MNYEDLLSSDVWKKKRNNIIQRDKHTCKSCKNSTYSQLPHGLVLTSVSKIKIMIIYNYIEKKAVFCWFPSLTTENYNEKIAYYDKIDVSHRG